MESRARAHEINFALVLSTPFARASFLFRAAALSYEVYEPHAHAKEREREREDVILLRRVN